MNVADDRCGIADDRLRQALLDGHVGLAAVRERVAGDPVLSAPPAAPAAPSPVPAHRRVDAKRQALDRLARRWAELRRAIDPSYSWPQAQARVNRAMGLHRRPDAGGRQLNDGIAFLRSELTKLSRTYPQEAERLRIPGSVEAIDGRLTAARGDRTPR